MGAGSSDAKKMQRKKDKKEKTVAQGTLGTKWRCLDTKSPKKFCKS